MSELGNSEDPGGSKVYPAARRNSSVTSINNTVQDSNIDQPSASVHRAQSSVQFEHSSSRTGAEKSTQSNHVQDNSASVNEVAEKCKNISVSVETDSISQQKSKEPSKRELIQVAKNLPGVNFSSVNPKYRDYFGNEVGPMYSGSSAASTSFDLTQEQRELIFYNSKYMTEVAVLEGLSGRIPPSQYQSSPVLQNHQNMHMPNGLSPNMAMQNAPNMMTHNTNLVYTLQHMQNPHFMMSGPSLNFAVPNVSNHMPNVQNQIQHNVLNAQNLHMNIPILTSRDRALQNAFYAANSMNPPILSLQQNNNPNFPVHPLTKNAIHIGKQNTTSENVPIAAHHSQNYPKVVQKPNNQNCSRDVKKNKCDVPEEKDLMKRQHLENLKNHPLLRNTINFSAENQSFQQSSPTKNEKNKKGKKTKTKKKTFEKYLSAEEVEKGLQENKLFEGVLRINPKLYAHAYLSTNKDEQDIFIDGLKKRNRALDGDIVVVQIVEPDNKPEKKTADKKEQNSDSEYSDNDVDETQEDQILSENKENSKDNRQGKVVFIKEKVHPRTCTGYLKLMPDKNKFRALFFPRDCRIPRLNVLATCWPDNFYKRAKDYENTIFLAKIVEWDDVRYAMGTLIRNVGEAGNLYAEMTAILSENCLDVTPFGPEVKSLFPGPDYRIPDEEILKREDCRKLCIFSIDPANCRDVDDAMSCRPLKNGNFEVGVHISDVSYYLKENTILDVKVADKATTVYMVEKAFHMLPEELCLLCSLFSGVDKLAFSVFWEITPEAEVLNHRFSKTIIHSCAQLSYEHAQAILDEAEVTDFPTIYNGFSFEDIKSTVKILGKLSSIFRSKRFEGGALRIDQPKLNFVLSPENGFPESFHIHESRPSHQLIEEFMLLANMTVAERIFKDHPKLAFLRCHPEPSKFQLVELVKQLKALDIDLDITSSGTLFKSLMPHIGPDCENQEKAQVISMMCTKPMTRAMYFCAAKQDDDYFRHYALNVDLYTHFTSPIRRYADIMVHRLLSASLTSQTPKWDIDRVQYIAANCNKQKYNAKRAGEKSTELYTLKYIEMHAPMMTKAIVVEVREKSFDVIVLAMNLNRRIYVDDIPGIETTFHRSKTGNKLSKLDVVWPESGAAPATKLTIQLFSVVQIEMVKGEDMLKVETRLLRPL